MRVLNKKYYTLGDPAINLSKKKIMNGPRRLWHQQLYTQDKNKV